MGEFVGVAMGVFVRVAMGEFVRAAVGDDEAADFHAATMGPLSSILRALSLLAFPIILP